MTDGPKLRGKTAVITGGGSGIGRATAGLLAADGAHVLIAGRTADKLTRVAGELDPIAVAAGGSVRVRVCDAGEEDDVRALVEDGATPTGALDMAVAVVGGGGISPVLRYSVELLQRTFHNNIITAALLLKHAGGAMVRAGGGSFVAVSSMQAIQSAPMLAAYCGAKAGLEMYCKVAADELGASNVRVNLVRPGFTRTDATTSMMSNQTVIDEYLVQQPIARTGEAEDIAHAIRYFLGPESGWTTGQSLTVDGGCTTAASPTCTTCGSHGWVTSWRRPRAVRWTERVEETRAGETWGLDGPYYDDLAPGHVFVPAPAITIGPGECALYQAIVGDPLAISLSSTVGEAVTGVAGGVVNPALALHVSIGQSTVATRRVIANLFYRGVVVRRTLPVGSTLSTTVEARAMRETSRKPDRPPRGMVLLGIRTVDQHGEVVAEFERCALLPFRDPGAAPGFADDLGASDGALDLASFAEHAPQGWHLGSLPAGDTGWVIGESRTDPLRDTVTDAPALVRLTQNLAAPHRDARLGQRGRRLVYGGHTIGLAQASLVRQLPSTATVVGWQSCDHVGPVFEDDVLTVTTTIDAATPHDGGRLLACTVLVDAEREGLGAPTPVLEWKPVVFAR
jgi:2-methylfumaryl-CoA hydratase